MKGQRRTGSFSIISSVLFLFLTWTGPGGAQAQDITVDSADPPSAEQGTVNLDVVIRGSGFKKGDKAKFLVTTANDPGGIKVNSTKVRGSTRIIANIDVASDAQTEKKFDIEIFSNGRSGKGIERFKVTKKGGGTEGQCDLTGATPTDFTLVRTLTLETLREDSRFGNIVRGRQLVDLTVNDKVEPILLAITERAGAETGGPGRVNLYLLEPSGIVSRLVRLVDGKKENVTLETSSDPRPSSSRTSTETTCRISSAPALNSRRSRCS